MPNHVVIPKIEGLQIRLCTEYVIFFSDSLMDVPQLLYIYLHINQLDALNFYNEFISRLYMVPAHVLIVRRSKLQCARNMLRHEINSL